MNSTSMKEVVEVRLGGYHATFDADNLATLKDVGSPDDYSSQALLDLFDLVTDLCCGIDPPGPQYCLQYLKHLKNLRLLLNELHKINVTEEKGGER